MPSLVWFRDDLRLIDHAALTAAAEDPDGFVALYVLDEETPGVRPLGGATRWWLHHSLESLRDQLAQHGVPLILRRGSGAQVVHEIVREHQISQVFWNRRYGPERHSDAALKTELREFGVSTRSYSGALLYEPGSVLTQQETPYRVYSPFWRACLNRPSPDLPLPAPEVFRPASVTLDSDGLDDWSLLPHDPDWASEFGEHWTPGEPSALHKLDEFLTSKVSRYEAERDIPSEDVTSELAPHLRWGEISPRTVWHEALQSGADVGKFLSELGWREFAWHTLFHNPTLHNTNIDRRFDTFAWQPADEDELSAWQSGRTGFPIVDAGMKELWRTGTMHNRVRMVVASFLTKNLLTDWRIGEAWFWDTLVDADAASNPFNWQWVAGCGVDAAPYFRIFNPMTQQKKFDPDGEYINRWAPESLLETPLVDLQASRHRALDAFGDIKTALKDTKNDAMNE